MVGRILVTGFGPFANHPVNASSETLKKLSQELALDGIEIDFKELPVVYESTKEFISSYWKSKCPLFSVHLGVYTEKFISIECQCNETDYVLRDVDGNIPCDGTWSFVTSSLPLDDVVNSLSKQSLPLPVQLSKDAGKYLCQYSYHNSLCSGNRKSVFIHVPKLEDSPVENTASVVKLIIEELLRFSSQNENA